MSKTFVLQSRSTRQLEQLEYLTTIDPCLAGGYRHSRLRGESTRRGKQVMRLLEHGDEQVCEIDKGFLVCVGNARMSQDWAVSFRSLEECLRIRILQAGRASFLGPDWRSESSAASCCYAIQPPGAWMSVHYRGYEPLRVINISITRRYLREVLGLAEEELPPVLTRHWQKPDCVFGALSMSRATHRLAASLYNVTAPGRWHHVRLAALGTQLLSGVFTDWLAQGDASTPPMKLSRPDTDRLGHALELIESTLQEPLTLDQLARRVGLNRNKLHYGLRQLIGMSANDYYAQLRMKRALTLLLDTRHSINQISEMLGYSEHTNFTSVFKKHFGATPREVRRDTRRPGS